MSYAINLIDGIDIVYARSNNVTQSITDFVDFLNKMSNARREYCQTMNKLIESFRSKKLTGGNVLYTGSVKTAMESYMNALDEDTNTQIQITILMAGAAKKLETKIKEIDKENKDLMAQAMKETKEFSTQKQLLKKNKEKYNQLSRELEGMKEMETKASTDPTMKPSKLQQMQIKKEQLMQKQKEAEDSYRSTLGKTNEMQKTYYTATQPTILTDFQNHEQISINILKAILMDFVTCYSVLPDATNKFNEYLKKNFSAVCFIMMFGIY